jgi:hypothetical protein
MKLRTAMVIFLISALVACGGGRLLPSSDGASTPADSVRTGTGSPAFDALTQLDPKLAEQLKPLASNPFECNAALSKVPGMYAEMVVLDGSVHGSVFKSVPGQASIWFLGKFIRATPGPTPSPGSTPTPKTTPTPIETAPPGQPLYVYAGTYSLHKYGQGCAFVLTSVNGKKIKKDKNNGLAVGIPSFKFNTNIVPSTIQEGPLSMSIQNLSAKGGNGSVQLLNAAGHGPNLDSGTITLTSRVELKP